jgi:eukaryotic-like serine/threonine-protein kinase
MFGLRVVGPKLASALNAMSNRADESTSPGEYRPGQLLLGKYRLLAPLARGGMGEVWQAENELLSSAVALKIMFRTETDASETSRRRAHSEASLAAQLHHPAVCAALDFGISDAGDPLVVSELLTGEGLDQVLLEQGPLSAIRAAQLILPIVDALGAAHDAGIVHRDVKPSNLFLARDAQGGIQPKLLDFGIARGVSESTHITVAGSICGTPDYMSPEQARGRRDVDARSDLWSVCATIYELVSGRAPFAADNYNAVIFAVVQHEPAPLSQLPAADRGLAKIVERGLRKQREERFQSARELARALSEFLLSRGVETDVCGHSLRARLSAAEVAAAPLPLLKLKAAAPPRCGERSRHAETESRASKRTGTRSSLRLRRAGALVAIAATLAVLNGWRAHRQPPGVPGATPAVALTEPIRFEPPSAVARLDSNEPSADAKPEPRRSATAPNAKPARVAERTAPRGKRSKDALRSNALGYDFGL